MKKPQINEYYDELVRVSQLIFETFEMNGVSNPVAMASLQFLLANMLKACNLSYEKYKEYMDHTTKSLETVWTRIDE